MRQPLSPSGMHNILCTVATAISTLTGPVTADPSAVGDPPRGESPVVEAAAGDGRVVGYGLSVFQGSRPQRFEVEVLGEMGGFAVGDDYILARLTGAGLEDSGVVAGMSGSPVYVDDELIGAVAFAWPFADEAVGGITPIDSMRRQLLAPTPQTVRPTSVTWDELFDLARPHRRLQQWMSRLVPRSNAEGRVALQLAASGMFPAARDWLGSVVGELAPAGSSDHVGPLTPGSAVAGILVDGDWKLAVTGTVTDVEGDRVLAFGHPFIGNGSTDIPMAPAEVVSIVSSQFVSFKVSNFGQPVGRFDFDRATGVGGRIGEHATTVPLEVALDPAGKSYSMRLAQVPELLPLLVGVSVFQSTAAAGHTGGTYGLRLRAVFDLGESGELKLEAVHDGTSAAVSAALQLIQYADFLHNNPWQAVGLEAVRVEVTQHQQPVSLAVLAATINRTRVEAGDSVRGTVRLKGYRSEVEEHEFEFALPVDLDPGQYNLLVGDAQTVDLTRWAATGEQPRTLEQALRLLRRLRSPDALAIVGLRQAGGMAVDGVSLPGLPPSVARLVADGAGTQAVAWAFESLLEQSSDRPLNGVVRLTLEVTEPERSSDDQQENGG